MRPREFFAVPTTDPSSSQPWLESQRRSRQRRAAAQRSRRRRWSGRAAAGVALASLTLASAGAMAADSVGGAQAARAAAPRPAKAAIVAAQRKLGIRADGIAGPQTRRALKRFQRAHGLKPDGVLGSRTLATLGLAPKAPASGGATFDAVSAVPVAPGTAAEPAATLARIAACESGGDPAAVSADGRYRGKYQFTRATWKAMGGTGDPAQADEATQDALAARLLAARGTAPWPACGR
jgi:hypothetical protein